MGMTITSTAFAHHGSIPKQYTCDGSDASAPLTWAGVPANVKSLVLIVDDPDAPDRAAPQRTWVHWLLYNLPVASAGLTEGIAALPTARWRGATTGSAPTTAIRARPSGAIATPTSSTCWMWCCRTSISPTKPHWKKQCKLTSWRRPNLSVCASATDMG